MNRRDLLKGILACGVAPAFIGARVLMPVRPIWTPGLYPAKAWQFPESINYIYTHEYLIPDWSAQAMERRFGKTIRQEIEIVNASFEVQA